MSRHGIGVETGPALWASRHSSWCSDRPSEPRVSRPGVLTERAACDDIASGTCDSTCQRAQCARSARALCIRPTYYSALCYALFGYGA